MSPASQPAPLAAAKLAFAVTLSVLAAGSASAGGELRVDWSTIDAGGGTTTGGNFSLNGTIAQVDADPLQPSSGGNFEVTGGFWVLASQAASDALFKDGFEGL